MTHRENWKWVVPVSLSLYNRSMHIHIINIRWGAARSSPSICPLTLHPCYLSPLLSLHHTFFFPSWQGAAWASAREAQGSRGHACGDGADPHRHAGGGSDSPGAVEAAAPPLVQCEWRWCTGGRRHLETLRGICVQRTSLWPYLVPLKGSSNPMHVFVKFSK